MKDTTINQIKAETRLHL